VPLISGILNGKKVIEAEESEEDEDEDEEDEDEDEEAPPPPLPPKVTEPKDEAADTADAVSTDLNGPYFHGLIKKGEADDLLTGCEDGTFLFRQKGASTDNFILSVVYNGNPTHHAVVRTAAGSEFTVNKSPSGAKTLVAVARFLETKTKQWPVSLIAGIANGKEEEQEDESEEDEEEHEEQAPLPQTTELKSELALQEDEGEQVVAEQAKQTEQTDSNNNSSSDMPSWFHGFLSKMEAEGLLLENDGAGRDGKFLLRSKGMSTDDLILSVIFRGRPSHHSLKRASPGKVYIVNKKINTDCTELGEVRSYLSRTQKRWPVPLGEYVVATKRDSSPKKATDPSFDAGKDDEEYNGFEEPQPPEDWDPSKDTNLDQVGLIDPTSPTIIDAMSLTVEPVMRVVPMVATTQVKKKNRSKTWRKKKMQNLHDSFNTPQGFGSFGNLVAPSHARLREQGKAAKVGGGFQIARHGKRSSVSNVFGQASSVLQSRSGMAGAMSGLSSGPSASSMFLDEDELANAYMGSDLNTQLFDMSGALSPGSVMASLHMPNAPASIAQESSPPPLSPKASMTLQGFGSSYGMPSPMGDFSSDPQMQLSGFAVDPVQPDDNMECTFLGNCRCPDCRDGW
jgi:hypothetical protein